MKFNCISFRLQDRSFPRSHGNPVWMTLISMLLMMVLQPMVHGQTDTARITGSVADTSGAVIPGATVTITNLEQGTAYNAVSDGSGNFTVAALPRGTYNVSVTANGFQSASEGITLDVSQVQALNFKLTPGAVTTSVTVTDAAPLVETSTSSTGEVIQGRQVTELAVKRAKLHLAGTVDARSYTRAIRQLSQRREWRCGDLPQPGKRRRSRVEQWTAAAGK